MAVSIGIVTSGELKAVLKGLRKGELSIVKFLYNTKITISPVTGNLYATFIPIVVKLNMTKIVSNGLVGAITQKDTFLKLISYAKKAEYQSVVPIFEKAVAETSGFKDLINGSPVAVDVFFGLAKQNPSIAVEEIVGVSNLARNLPGESIATFVTDLGDAGLRAAMAKEPGLVDGWKKFDEAGLIVLKKDPIQLRKFDDIVKGNNLGLDADGLGDLLKARTKERNLTWEHPEKVLDAVKHASDGRIDGVSIKGFPTPEDGSTSFILSNAKQYQYEGSGDAFLSFDKGGRSFDNVSSDGKLIDRKYGHGSSVFNADGTVKNQSRAQGILVQGQAQVEAANGTPIRWEVSTELGAEGIQILFDNAGIDIEVIYVAQKMVIN